MKRRRIKMILTLMKTRMKLLIAKKKDHTEISRMMIKMIRMRKNKMMMIMIMMMITIMIMIMIMIMMMRSRSRKMKLKGR